MAITRRDMVVLSVLFNVVILACVIATAKQLSSPAAQEKSVAKELPSPQEMKINEEAPIAYDEIDQLLEEYASSSPKETVETKQKQKKEAVAKSSSSSAKKEAGTYIVRQGDNPWTIARKFHLSFEKLLELNGLNEETAKNLKIGQSLKIREE